jgi:hypothetical protein
VLFEFKNDYVQCGIGMELDLNVVLHSTEHHIDYILNVRLLNSC